MKNIKHLTAIILAIAMVFVSVPVSNAQAETPSSVVKNYEQKDNPHRIPHISAECPDCHRYNVNYGYDKWFYGGTHSFSSGTTCGYCHNTVPAGKRHVCTYFRDKYFFICSYCGNDYACPGDPEYTDHYIVDA